MKSYIGLTAVVFGLSAASAFAQAPPEPSTLPKAPPEISAEAPPPPPPGPRGSERGPGPERGPGRDMGPGHHRPPPPPPSKGAHFVVRMGNSLIDLKCAEDEPQKVCADLLLEILDRAKPSSDDRDSGRGFNRDRDYDRDRDRR